MRLMFAFIFLCMGALLQAVQFDSDGAIKLEKRYEFSQNEITSQVIFEDAPLFELHTVAKSVNFYRMKSSVIVEKFKKHNIKVIPSSAIVEFVRTQQDRVPFLEEKIGPLFVQYYSKYNILVQDVIITPVSYAEVDEGSFQDYSFVEKHLKRSNGSFFATFITPKGDLKRIYFRYIVKATLEAVITTQTLRAGDVIEMGGVKIDRIVFEKMNRDLMQKSDIGQYSIRNYTSKNTVLYKNDLTPKIVIRRGDSVYVLINDGRVLLSFDGVAQQDGAIGKKIRVKNPRTNKSYDATIIDEKRVEVH